MESKGFKWGVNYLHIKYYPSAEEEGDSYPLSDQFRDNFCDNTTYVEIHNLLEY